MNEDSPGGAEHIEQAAMPDITAPAATPVLAAAPHRPSHGWIYLIVVVAILAITIGWAVCSVYLLKIDVGRASLTAHSGDATLTKLLTQQTTTYRLSIRYPDGSTKKFPATTAGIVLDSAASLRATRFQQHKLSNRMVWWRPIRAVLVVHKNTAVFNNFVATNISITAQPSQDAGLKISGGQIQITDAVTGRQYGINNPERVLSAAVATLQTSPIKLQTLKVNPALTASILQPYKAQLEKILNQPASLVIGDQTVKPTPEDIANWLDITPNDQTKKVDIAVNSGKVVEYINGVAAAAIHPARAQVDLNMPDGSTQVLVPGINGVDILNKSTVATSVATNLLTAQGFNYTLPVNWQAFQTVTTGYYPKWIEVDLTNKKLYAYEYGTLVATYLASAGAPKTPTVTGQFNIYAKFDQQNMQGENVDGSNYYQPHVQWINYFYKDYAIHGNYWRPLSYFGRVNSSHGCVGLVNTEASWVYGWAPIGTPVVVHT